MKRRPLALSASSTELEGLGPLSKRARTVVTHYAVRDPDAPWGAADDAPVVWYRHAVADERLARTVRTQLEARVGENAQDAGQVLELLAAPWLPADAATDPDIPDKYTRAAPRAPLGPPQCVREARGFVMMSPAASLARFYLEQRGSEPTHWLRLPLGWRPDELMPPSELVALLGRGQPEVVGS